ncbi:MAG: efflux RND transporter periplasmic adaptor subunit [Nitrospirota bacterium]|nr:efflux RND transporter periplasmic adaptor subunit [Nitrospirota bacterium]
MKGWVRIALPALVVGAGVGIGMVLMSTGPEAERRTPPPSVPTVEAVRVAEQDFPVTVTTRGTVTPRTQSTLIPEVAGRVVWINPNLRGGGFFEAGDTLLRIDATDYENAVTVARAELARARLALEQEEAQSAQALRDWEALGMGGEPAGLALRRPQLETARADADAAAARLTQAEVELSRTRLRAPYAGRALEKKVDVGQYVSPGTVLATVYAVDYVEVRLPLTDRQLAYVDLPERYRGENAAGTRGPAVTLSAQVGGLTQRWKGRIVRAEGAIDTASRQLFVVAQVDDPYARRGDSPPLKIGQFVEAEIAGRTLHQVFVLPRQAMEADGAVRVITPENTLSRRPVTVAWSGDDRVVIADGLRAGERVSVTPMPYAADGAPVRVQGDPEPERRPGGPGKPAPDGG